MREEPLSCRDCGAPSLAATGPVLPLLRVVLGLRTRVGENALHGSPASLSPGEPTPAEVGSAFLAEGGLDDEASLQAVLNGTCAGVVTAKDAPRAASIRATASTGAPMRGLRARPRVGVSFDARVLAHSPGVGPAPTPPALLSQIHPERPDRVHVAVGWLAAVGLLQECVRIQSREATDAEITLVAGETHRARLESAVKSAERLGGVLEGDTYINSNGTVLAARLALGSTIEAALACSRGVCDAAVVLTRPPGHHACAREFRGFCVYSNVAGAARAVLDDGARRVLIIDWDVHHGDGTEELLLNEPRALVISVHRFGDFYPGTGRPSVVGGPSASARGRNVNVALRGDFFGDADYAAVLDAIIAPLARAFDPDLVLVSSGFDAARGDQLGDCDVTPAGYAALTAGIIAAAPRAPVVVVLEGGYNLQSIGASTEAVTRVLFGERPIPLNAFDAETNMVAVSQVLARDEDGEDEAALNQNLRDALEWEHGGETRDPSDVHPRRRIRPATWDAILETRRAHTAYWPCFAGAARET